MKSIKLLIVSLVMFLLIPLVALADAGGPSFTTYSARVTNKDGTCFLDWDGSGNLVKGKCFNFDDIIENIYYEELIDGIQYGVTSEGIVKLSDIVALSDKIDFSNFDKTKGEFYVFKDLSNIYKGPSRTYGKIDADVVIPAGTILKYTYHDDMFSYIEYNGIKGWVYSYYDGFYDLYNDELCVARQESGRVYIVNTANIYTLPNNGEKTGASVPKDTYVEYKYIVNINGEKYAYYVNYNGNKGWIIEDAELFNIARIKKGAKLFTHLEAVDICKTTDASCTKVGSIPKNTIVNIEYFFKWSRYYVKYNGVSGWVRPKDYNETESDPLVFYHGEYVDEVTFENEISLYDNIYGNETKTKLAAGTYEYDFEVSDNNNYENGIYWYHITSGKNTGWVKIKNNYDDPGQGTDIDEPTEPDDDVDTPRNRDYEPKGLVLGETVTYALIGTVGLGVVIIVLIVILNNYSNKVTKKTEEEKKNKENIE